MNPHTAWRLAQPLAKLYEGIEDDLISHLVSTLAKNLDITDTAKWEVRMLAKMGGLRKDAVKIIARRAGVAPELLQVALESAAKDEINKLEPGFRAMVQGGYAKNTRVPPHRAIQGAVKAYWRQAADGLNMVNTVMQYKVKPAWINLVKGVRGYIDQAVESQPVHDVLGKHAGAAVIGTETRKQAVRKAINDLLDDGIPAFVDKRGREWSPEAYVNMDIRTTVTNTAHQAQFDRMDHYGLNLIEVSSHSGARPKCARDQGKIFDRGNKSGYVKDLRGNRVRYYPWSSSSYGEPDGILGINCGHFIYPFFPGASAQRYFPVEDADENDRLYQQGQQQRALERKVRRAKQECMAYDAVGDNLAFQKASAKLKNSRDQLDAFTRATGRTRRTDREQVVGFNRNLSSKATAAAKKEAQREEYIKKIKPTLPKVAKAKDATLQHAVVFKAGIIPKGAEAKNVRVIAGYGTASNLRDAKRLAQSHGGDDWKWEKKGGIIESKHSYYDAHWYEYEGKMYEEKVKGVKKK